MKAATLRFSLQKCNAAKSFLTLHVVDENPPMAKRASGNAACLPDGPYRVFEYKKNAVH